MTPLAVLKFTPAGSDSQLRVSRGYNAVGSDAMRGDLGNPTLYEDWQARRDQIASIPHEQGQQRELQLNVLDYLLRRYCDSPLTARPVKVALTATLAINERAIIVHQYLGQGQVAGVKSAKEAADRVGAIVRRMASSQNEDGDVEPSQDTDAFGADPQVPGFDIEPEIRIPAVEWRDVLRAIHSGSHQHYFIARSLVKSPVLPRKALVFLSSELAKPEEQNWDALELLAQCKNRSVFIHALNAWRARLMAGVNDLLTEKLCQFLLKNDAQSAEAFRGELASQHFLVRTEAARWLAEIGTLDDVNLFSDLLRLPLQPDQHPDERRVYADAMQRLAEQDAS